MYSRRWCADEFRELHPSSLASLILALPATLPGPRPRPFSTMRFRVFPFHASDFSSAPGEANVFGVCASEFRAAPSISLNPVCPGRWYVGVLGCYAPVGVTLRSVWSKLCPPPSPLPRVQRQSASNTTVRASVSQPSLCHGSCLLLSCRDQLRAPIVCRRGHACPAKHVPQGDHRLANC